MSTVKASGTQAAVISTVHTLATIADAGDYELYLDCGNMVSGDIINVNVNKKILAAGSLINIQSASYAGQQSPAIIRSYPLSSEHEMTITIEQEAGTAKSFDWSITQLDG